jgi:hypothetical protein
VVLNFSRMVRGGAGTSIGTLGGRSATGSGALLARASAGAPPGFHRSASRAMGSIPCRRVTNARILGPSSILEGQRLSAFQTTIKKRSVRAGGSRWTRYYFWTRVLAHHVEASPFLCVWSEHIKNSPGYNFDHPWLRGRKYYIWGDFWFWCRLPESVMY